MLEILHAVPKRTRVWLLGDFNGHVGADLRGSGVGPQCQDVTNNNGAARVHACESAGLLLANSFSGWAPTCWSPDGQSSHYIDFVAIPQECRLRMRCCRVNRVLGKRWQLSPVRDHWPVEVVVSLPRPWVLLRKASLPIRWNKHALQVALEEDSAANAFLRDCMQSLSAESPPLLGSVTRAEVETRWNQVASSLHDVAVRHFAMRPSQKTSKILPRTFDLLRQRRDAMQLFMDHVDSWSAASVRRPLAWFFEAFRLLTAHSRAAANAKQAVKADSKAWNARLESRLQRAVDLCDSREAWSVCRQLAGHGPSKVYDRVVPAACSITRKQWQQQLRTVWVAWVHEEAVVVPERCEAHPMLPAGDVGCRTFLQAAKSQARFRATPREPCLVAAADAAICMRSFEAMQVVGCNPQACCDGQGCALPKPGNVPGPDGQRIISLLDPAGKMFYKALLGLMPDSPADHQYGYAPGRSRPEAVLQVAKNARIANSLASFLCVKDLAECEDGLDWTVHVFCQVISLSSEVRPSPRPVFVNLQLVKLISPLIVWG